MIREMDGIPQGVESNCGRFEINRRDPSLSMANPV